MAAATNYASASLYVGDINTDVSEALLFEMFNPVGPVASIRVCRDAVTRRSLGYAYVNYHNVTDAERALDTLNYTQIKNRSVRIMWSHRDPSVRKSGVGNVFIKNLAQSIDHKSLYDTFSYFGNILSCKVMTDDQGNSKGFGFVHYETKEAAEKAIEKLNGMMLNEKQVYVAHFVPRKAPGEAKFTNIYVKNIPDDYDDDKLTKLFSKCGEVANSIVMKDKEGKSKGFGFVNYKDTDAAKKSIEDLHESEIDGKMLYVSRAQKKSERDAELKKKYAAQQAERLNKYQGVNLYVKNLDDTITDEQLRTEFGVHGTITSAKVMRDDKGITKGFGFVCFSTADEATKAVTETNGRMIGSKPIYVALAQRKEVRRAALEAQHQQRAGLARQQLPGNMGMYPAGQPVYYQNMPQGARGPAMAAYGGYPMMGQQRGPGRYNAPNQGGRGAGFPQQGMYMGNNMQNQGRQQGGRQQQRNARGNQGNQQRNNQRDIQGGAGMQHAAPAAAAAASEGNNLTQLLASSTASEQKQILGERLYPLIHKEKKELAGKITGMLLEMDNSELLNLLESPEDLTEKVNEAVQVLEEHARKEKEQE